MLLGHRITMVDVVEMLQFLGEPITQQRKKWIMENIPYRLSAAPSGRIQAFCFDRDALWNKLFLADESLRKPLAFRRIESLERLEYETIEHRERGPRRPDPYTGNGSPDIDPPDELDKLDSLLYG